MRATIRKVMVSAVAGMVLCSCAWVEVTPEGERVRVLGANEVAGCTEIGTTTSSLKDEIAGIPRNREKVSAELETLARNAAAGMSGDAVVPVGEPQDGKQTFAVYRCLRP